MDQLLRSLPGSDGAPSSQTFVEATITLEAPLFNRLRLFAGALSCPVEQLLLTGYAALLFRLSGQDEVTISSARSKAVSLVFADQATFRSAVVGMRSVPAGPDSSATFHFGSDHDAARPVLRAAALQLSAAEDGDRLTLSLSSATEEWQQGTLESWLLYLRNLLDAAVSQESTPVSQLRLLEVDALRDLYARLNDTVTPYPREKPVHRLFAERVAASPQSTAVIAGNGELTYCQLDRQSTELAIRLTAMGAVPGRPVAICLERSTFLSVALLAVLKSGSCYVPLDPQHPQQRLTTILEECQPVAVITQTRLAHSVSRAGFPLIELDLPQGDLPSELEGVPHSGHHSSDPWDGNVSCAGPDDLAYIIFTSGTTGKPKGVTITHGALTNLLCAMQKTPGMNASDRLLALATISFDMAVVDMFLPLVTGATLVIADRSAAGDPFTLAQLIEQHDITCMQATPTTWKMLIQSGWTGKRSLKVLCGGEALPRDLANDMLEMVGELWNCYGPTETTVWSAFLRLKGRNGIVPVGPPLANTTFYVMDDAGQPVPAGVPGELYIGGDGVATSYFQQPELTRQRFVADVYQPAARVFRTGDLVRLMEGSNLESSNLESSNLEFFGRMDHQVKLRGFRIELGEIEAVLRSHETVATAVLLLRNDVDHEPRLVAYLVPQKATLDLDELRDHCALLLPAYMIPAEFVELAHLPLTSSGKVDRKALPAPDPLQRSRKQKTSAGVAPQDELETKLLAIFREVLGEQAMGTTDSFFDYGGYSLLSVKLFTKINKSLNRSLPISLIFDAPTVSSLAAVIRSGVEPPVIVPIRPEGAGTPLFIVHSYLLYAALFQTVASSSAIYGIREGAGDRTLHTIEERAELYANEILKVSSAGPVDLAGWCAASSLTVEVARRLQGKGHRVELVALFDGERPGFDERIAQSRPSLLALLRTAWKFHLQRIRVLPPAKVFQYLRDWLLRHLEARVESFFTRHRSVIAWLERHLRFLLPDRFFDNIWANSAAVQDFSNKPYDGALTLFRAADVPRYSNADETLGWADVAREGVQVIFVPGDHESMFRPPHLDSFGEKLREAMASGHSTIFLHR